MCHVSASVLAGPFHAHNNQLHRNCPAAAYSTTIQWQNVTLTLYLWLAPMLPACDYPIADMYIQPDSHSSDVQSLVCPCHKLQAWLKFAADNSNCQRPFNELGRGTSCILTLQVHSWGGAQGTDCRGIKRSAWCCKCLCREWQLTLSNNLLLQICMSQISNSCYQCNGMQTSSLQCSSSQYMCQ